MELQRSLLNTCDEEGYSPWVKRFAWFPTLVGNSWIWLQKFEQRNYYWGWGGCDEQRRLP